MTIAVQPKVYVVDDDQGMLDSTVWLLESVGLSALAFTSGQAFLQACDARLNACVILDVRMPSMGGLHVQQALIERGINLPVIFVSGHADVPIVVRAFKAGAHDFIEKPYNQQLLLDSVQQALSGGNARQSASQELTELEARLLSLTPRERDVLDGILAGEPNKRIAAQLCIAEKTVEAHRARLMIKLEARNVVELLKSVIAARDPGVNRNN